MAWLERDPSGNYHIAFRFGGRKFRRSLRTKTKRQAEARCARLEENSQLVESGRLTIPDGADVAAFLLSDGKLNGKPKVKARISLTEVFALYIDELPPGSLETETLRIAHIHMRHFQRHLGKKFPIDGLTQADLQNYVNQRARQPGIHGRKVSPTTIKKELSTLHTVWNWARTRGYVVSDFPTSTRFPKSEDKPRFQTWNEILRQISRSDLNEDEQQSLWDCLYLELHEIGELLEFVQSNAQYDFLYPMVVTAAHTGARRSELCRSRESDFDFTNGVLTIHERKRAKARRTNRQVPISNQLATVMQNWFRKKRSSDFTFPVEYKVSRNRKERETMDAVSPDEASSQLSTTLNGSKWKVVRGWHIFRHSFCSNCASAGIDQRMIDSWVGHQTDEMRQRYRHLFPDAQRKALETLFSSDGVKPN